MFEAGRWADAIVMPFSVAHAEETIHFMKEFPTKVRILCGNYAKHIASSLLSERICEIVIGGEPEFPILEALSHPDQWQNVQGIVYRKNGETVATGNRPFLKDLDTLPFPARRLLNQEKYWDISFFGEPTTWVITSRGCPYDCVYCSQWETFGKQVRYRNPGKVVDELEEIVRVDKIRNVVLFDETFNLKDSHVRGICEGILERKLDLRWWCAARADLAKPDVVRLMKKAGCIEMRCGYESGDDSILQYLQRGMILDEFFQGVEVIHRERMTLSVHVIFGSPMETRQTIMDTLRLLKRIRPLWVSFNLLTPLPGSQLFMQLKDKLKLDQVKTFDLVHTDYAISQDFSTDELKRWLLRGYLYHYLSPQFMWTLIKRCVRDPWFLKGLINTISKQGWYIWKSVFRNREETEFRKAHLPLKPAGVLVKGYAGR
jgi:anaerobic magnesium-protoporphyrin IX monomethyl ester cyclase